MREYTKPKLTSRLTVEIEKDEELVVSKKKKLKLVPWRAIGNGEKNIKGGSSMDLIKIMSDMTQRELKMFNALYQKVKKSVEFYENDIGQFKPKFTYQQKMSLSGNDTRVFGLLKEKDVIKRVKRGVYMINPLLIIDTCGFQEVEEKLWLTL